MRPIAASFAIGFCIQHGIFMDGHHADPLIVHSSEDACEIARLARLECSQFDIQSLRSDLENSSRLYGMPAADSRTAAKIPNRPHESRQQLSKYD